MALQTMLNQFEKAKKEYDKQLKTLGKGLQQEVAQLLAPFIPEGWYLTWNQDDQQYDDQDYYFGLGDPMLCSIMRPRKGKLIKAETQNTTEQRTNGWGGTYEHVISYGSPAEYEWVLDETCKKYRGKGRGEWEGEPGVINLEYDDDGQCGLEPEDWAKLAKAFKSLNEDTYRKAFGDKADVRIYHDGTFTVD